MAAMAAKATMTAMAAMATVLSCVGIQHYSNKTTRHQDKFVISMESSLAGV